MKLLDSEEIEAGLENLPGWRSEGDHLEKDFQFDDFIETISIMVEIGFAAESIEHHPEWTNVYNRLNIRLSTHDAGGITEKDLDLARRIEAIVNP